MSQVFLLVKLDIDLSSGQRTELDLSHNVLLNNILSALKNLFGEVGAAYPVEILKINRTKQEFLLATFPEYQVKVRQGNGRSFVLVELGGGGGVVAGLGSGPASTISGSDYGTPHC
jgi:hypothetical protein